MAMDAVDSGGLSSFWWEEEKANLPKVLMSIVRHLNQNQAHHEQMNLRAMRLYGNLAVLGLSPYTYSQGSAVSAPYDRVSLNIVQSMCDTVTQKICKNKVKPTFLTSGGDYLLKKKAKLLDKFTQGMFSETRHYEKTPWVFKDASVFGTGAYHIYRDDESIHSERTFINELLVDDSDGVYGEPRSLYRKKFIPKEVLLKRWPKHRDKILHAKQSDQMTAANPNLSNNILVVEAWHLPSRQGASDGRHAIVIEGAAFVDERYNRPYFPFPMIRWTPRLLGFFGQGLAEQLTGLQIEINKILRTIQLSFHLCGVPGWMIEDSSKVISAHLNNEVGRIIKYQGMKPELYTPNPVAPQLFEHLERLYARAYEIAGISMLAASSKKPAGLDSGKALREFNDIEAERFILTGQAWEQFHMDSARQMIDLAKEIHEENGEFSVQVKGRKFLETVPWEKIDLDEDEYVMQVFPTSFLSNTPSGRLNDIKDLAQIGEFDKRTLMRLLDFPDLESFVSLATASLEDLEAQLEKIVDDGEYQAPEPFQDLSYGVQFFQSAYLKYKNDGLEPEKLELLTRWISEASELLKQSKLAAQPATPPQLGMPGGPVTAQPMATPQSGLLPVGPAAGGAPGGSAGMM